MPRYVIERDFGKVSEDEMQEVAAKSKVTGSDHFPDIRWEHSHVVADDDGAIKSFCVYEAPSTDRLQEHADRVGGHEVTGSTRSSATSRRRTSRSSRSRGPPRGCVHDGVEQRLVGDCALECERAPARVVR